MSAMREALALARGWIVRSGAAHPGGIVEQIDAALSAPDETAELREALRDAAIAADSRGSTREECQELISRLKAENWDEARKFAAKRARALSKHGGK